MSDGAAGEEICAGFGVGAGVFQRDAAGEFDLRAAADVGDPFLSLLGRKVVEQQVGCATRQGFVQLFAGPDFDLDGNTRIAGPI